MTKYTSLLTKIYSIWNITRIYFATSDSFILIRFINHITIIKIIMESEPSIIHKLFISKN